MEFIKKEDVEAVLQKYIDSRKKNCSRTTIIERTAFEYALRIVRSVKVYNFETDK